MTSQTFILLIDNDTERRQALNNSLQEMEYVLVVVEAYQQALAKLNNQSFDLVLLDINLPAENSRKILEHIQSNEHLSDISVVALVQEVEKGQLIRYIQLGIFDYIASPLDFDLLQLRLRAILTTVKAKENKRPILSIAEYAARTEMFAQVSRALLTTKNLPRLLRTIADSVAESLDADRVLLHIFDLTEQKIEHFVGSGPGLKDVIVFFSFRRLMEGLIGWVIREATPALRTKGMEDDRVTARIQEERVKLRSGSTIVVPVVVKEQAIGTVTVIYRPDQRDFTQEDVQLMTALASQIALALAYVGLYEAEQEHKFALQKQNEELDAFAGTVAHNLKTPLNTLSSYVELLHNTQNGTKDEDQTQWLEQVANASEQMKQTINSLLLLAKIHKEAIKVQPLNMASIIGRVEKRLNSMIQEYQAEFVLPHIWPVAIGYGPWIEEVWENYLTNALKYGGTPPKLELGATVQNNNLIRFWVRDNGHGINEKDQAKLFTPFTQLEQARAQGQGLGLSIVQRIIEKLDGEVGVDSQLEEGSLFWFALPAVAL